jgi:ABC-type glycerol-3-phosphate transport system permease component
MPRGGWRRGAGVWWLAAAPVILAGLFPLYWMVKSSLAPEASLFAAPSLLPRSPTLEHYRALIAERDFWLPVRNSFVVAASTTAWCLAFGAMAAYALARLRFRGKRVILALVLAVAMFPQVSILAPLFLALREVGLIDRYAGLVLPYLTFAMPLTIWLLVAYFRQLPPDLEEAALVDGASRVRVLREVVLPLAVPGLVTTGILTFLYCWNELLFALSFTVSAERQTVPVAVALLRGRYQIPWGQILAATVIATVPVALLVLAFQRRIVQGLTAGAVKG